MKKKICKVINKIHHVGGQTLMFNPALKMALPYYIPDSYEVIVDFDGKNKGMCVENNEWFQSLARGTNVEVSYKQPWWKFGGITIERMKKV